MPLDVPLIIGHRGAPGYRPEHTASSYRLAFAMGADAVEPDVVATSDGVLVIRHENEISGTTDVADRPEFVDRRTTKRIDGVPLTGWFTEDFTWAELATLRCRERLPALRPGSAGFDDIEPILRLTDLLELVAESSAEHGRELGVVLEIKHATFFAGIGHDLAALAERDLRAAGWASGEHPLWLESFEQSVLTDLRTRGVHGEYVYLLEAEGAPADLVARDGASAATYADALTPAGLDALTGVVDGISVDKQILLRDSGPQLVAQAHAGNLAVFTWTCRPENAFLDRRFRTGAGAAFGDYRAEWAALAATGVDGVFADHPDLGVDVFQRA
ncbi:MAG: glycerophosphodiester phosphodiesterase [Actinobacteria bacterium]|nr:glycerophosphodiester phosphodiesterase [Actinomycetota bacterium]